MIRRLALMVGGAVTAVTAAVTAFWAARRTGWTTGPGGKGGRRRGEGKGRRKVDGGSREAAQPAGSGSVSRGTGERVEQPGGASRRFGRGQSADAEERTEPAASEPGATAPGATGPGEDLRSIKGIGAVSEERLRELGVTTVAQIAAWSDEDVEAFAVRIKVSADRIRREDWVGQARTAAAEG